jgi:hypothetical protein
MAEQPTPWHVSAAHDPRHISGPINVEQAREALKHGPRGALTIASVAIALLIAGWLIFYFVLFMPRGPIG